MATKTITGTVGGVVLNLQIPADNYNPLYIAATGVVRGSTGDGVAGAPGFAWTIGNAGTVQGTIDGILLESGGSVANSGVITSYGPLGFAGIELMFPGSVTNGAAGTAGGLISGASAGVTVGDGDDAGSTVTNFGEIRGTQAGAKGVNLDLGGLVANDAPTAAITGVAWGVYEGVFGGRGTVVNAGTIAATGPVSASFSKAYFGVYLHAGGSITNGAGGATAALITGPNGGIKIQGAGGVANYATITATGPNAAAIRIFGAGTISNGTGGTISGPAYGIYDLGGGASIANLGNITATGAAGVGVRFEGMLSNGEPGSGGASIIGGHDGVQADNAGTILNYGLISALDAVSGYGIQLSNNAGQLVAIRNFTTIAGGHIGVGVPRGVGSYGVVVNGGSGDTVALITGAAAGIAIPGPSIVNYGAVIATGAGGSTGIHMLGHGTIANGSAGDLAALVQGDTGVFLEQGGEVANYATILGVGTSVAAGQLPAGIVLGSYASTVVIGSALDNAALVQGYQGIRALPGGKHRMPATIVNWGTVRGDGAGQGTGVYLGNGGTVTNYGLIAGYGGVVIETGVTGRNTVINAGTIAGYGGTALVFTGGADLLVADPGGVFIGTVAGNDRSTLELAAGGDGVLLGLGSAVAGFGAIVIDAAANWHLAGDASGGTLVNNGTVVIDAGNAIIFGLVGHDRGARGVIDIAGGGEAAFTAAVAKGETLVFTDATGVLQLVDPRAFAARISGFQSGDTIDLVDIGADRLTYAAGKLHLLDHGKAVATLSLSGDYTASDFRLRADGSGGTDIVFAAGASAVPAAPASSAEAPSFFEIHS